jgi:glycosyltransferase involved in cell wall biosynthesis
VRILVLHNHYKLAGGEDRVVEIERALLTEHDNPVELLTADSASIGGLLSGAATAFRATYSLKARRMAEEAVRRFRPDLVHLHNFFPLLSPSVLDACAQARLPAVHTLHNYRLACPGAYLMRGSRPCEVCLERSTLHAVPRRCYRNSAVATMTAVAMTEIHRRLRTWERKVDRFIALTEFGRDIFVRSGLPAGKIRVKPNTISPANRAPAEAESSQFRKSRGVLFVGRLSPEKGVETLLRARKLGHWELTIVGDGPLAGLVSRHAAASDGRLTYSGHLSPEEVNRAMARAAFLVMPSEWYEGFPLAVVEAFASALPVVASRLGSMAEIVEDGKTGLHFTAGDAQDLSEKVSWLLAHTNERIEMGAAARRAYEEKYTPEANYQALMAVYAEAIDAAKERYPVRL